VVRRLALLVALAASGCFQLDVPDGLQCADTPPVCPEGQTCMAGVCRSMGGDDPDADPNAPDGGDGPDGDMCSTQTELCNGQDDNCNGMTDEGFALGVACDGSGDSDLCQEGVTVCAPSEDTTECQDTTDDAMETCNGVDDNCDGATDEGCSCTDGGTQACGTDVGACVEGTQSCSGGTWGPCMGGVGPTAETCNGGDEDCDGMTDEDFPLGTTCTAGVGLCQRTGALVCNAAGTGTQCNAVPGAPATEVCNTLDDDCDGMNDDGDPGGGGACSTGLAGVCAAGTQHCISGAITCQQNVMSSTETCNSADDDCDGSTDEGFSGLGTSCDGSDGDFCNEGVTVCNAAGTGTTCTDSSSTNVEICNGLDEDCDAIVDDGFALGMMCDGSDGDSCFEGVTVCNTAGTGTTCNDTTGTSVEVCNTADDDCDGMINEGTCATGTTCNASTGSCQCNTSTGCGGCCSGGTTCNAGTSLGACGIGGNVCVACPIGRADTCNSSGQCRCGTGPACSGTLNCCDGACLSICP
jgi:hypothetical protein